jgi:molybdopterin/thiamine biosynthesis adenylyltransferase
VTWWITQIGRAQAERVAIADLESRSAWLEIVKWHLESGLRLAVDVVITHAADAFSLRLTYPAYFPEAPPSVIPTDGRRLSSHQYGAGGELCLEFRADNWEPSISGAMLLESAHRLIAGERISDQQLPVPSAHLVSVGQQIRGKGFRFLVDTSTSRALGSLPELTSHSVELAVRMLDDTFLAAVKSIGTESENGWSSQMPMPDSWSREAIAVRVSDQHDISALSSVAVVTELLNSIGLQGVSQSALAVGSTAHLLLANSSSAQLFMLHDHNEQRGLCSYHTIPLPDDGQLRMHENQLALGEKKVAVVGCGSVGSKIAASLARAGVDRFVLVDHDIFLPGNIGRNDLDWRAVGVHKADAVRVRLLEINANCNAIVRRAALGGQESAESTLSVMTELSTCDLIVDATADPQVFNYCAVVARKHTRPMVWAEVFGGGIGGIVARARPDIDPAPQAARRQIAAWCEAKGIPAPSSRIVDYSLTNPVDTAAPLIADDGDVGVVAAHATRLITDTLTRTDNSIFPQSAYVIGLSRGWIFSAPFETWPVDYFPEGVWSEPVDPDSPEHVIRFLEELSVVGETE